MNYRNIIIISFLILSLGASFSAAEEMTEEMMEEREEIVPQKEEKRIEVLIEARLIKIRLNEEHRKGVDWEAIVSNYQRLDLSQSREEAEGPSEDTRLRIGTVTNEDYVVLLEALEVVGQMTDLADPRIRAAVNQEAKIVWDAHMPGNGFELQMGLAPTLQDDGLLVINLDPRLRWITWDQPADERRKGRVYSSPSGIAVRLKSDETVVIGGLLQEKEVKKMSKFPLLGDLPLIGFAFRHQNRLIEKMEYIIFLSPKIVAEEG